MAGTLRMLKNQHPRILKLKQNRRRFPAQWWFCFTRIKQPIGKLNFAWSLLTTDCRDRHCIAQINCVTSKTFSRISTEKLKPHHIGQSVFRCVSISMRVTSSAFSI